MTGACGKSENRAEVLLISQEYTLLAAYSSSISWHSHEPKSRQTGKSEASFHMPSPASGMPDGPILKPCGRMTDAQLMCPFAISLSLTNIGDPWTDQVSMKKFWQFWQFSQFSQSEWKNRGITSGYNCRHTQYSCQTLNLNIPNSVLRTTWSRA